MNDDVVDLDEDEERSVWGNKGASFNIRAQTITFFFFLLGYKVVLFR